MDRAERLEAWDRLARPLVTPSLLDCDFGRMADQIAALAGAGVGAFHLDVMDGHFVPNLSYGPPVIKDWRPLTAAPFDAHLMIQDPARYLDDFVAAGCDVILFHIEVVPDPRPLIRRIRDAGCRPGLVLNPPTPWTAVEPYLADLETVLVMSVMPGFGGQSFQAGVLDKVRALRRARPGLRISIDGGIKGASGPGHASTAEQAVAAGVSQLVVGSAFYPADHDYAAALARLVEGVSRGLQQRGGDPQAGPSSPE